MSKEEYMMYLTRWKGMEKLRKTPALMRSKDGEDYPILYLTRAQGATDDEYQDVLDWLASGLRWFNLKDQNE